MAEKASNEAPKVVKPVALDRDELTAGLHFEREIAVAQANMQQVSMARNVFMNYLKVAKGVPDDWEIRNWEVGFEPPVNIHGHSH